MVEGVFSKIEKLSNTFTEALTLKQRFFQYQRIYKKTKTSMKRVVETLEVIPERLLIEIEISSVWLNDILAFISLLTLFMLFPLAYIGESTTSDKHFNYAEFVGPCLCSTFPRCNIIIAVNYLNRCQYQVMMHSMATHLN